MSYLTDVDFPCPAWPGSDDLKRVRDELDRLCRERYHHGLSVDDIELYQALSRYEEGLLLALARLTN